MTSPMTFTVAAPGAALPPARKPKAPAVPLGEFWKGYTSPGVYEVVKAATADGQWLFRRADDGTWEVVKAAPTETVVKPRLRSLPACRSYVAAGKAEADLERIQAKEKGNGSG